jgi:predicted deacylase
MLREIVRADELDLESRGRRDYFVALEHDSIWGDYLIPLTVMVGHEARPGAGLVAFGSTHGNEYEGPVVIRHLLREINPARVRGRIILVPVLNPAAFRAGTRDSTQDDGVNLNRAFVDSAGQTPALGRITHRIADFVRRAIWPHVHVIIDLHAGGEVACFAPGASFHPIEEPQQGRLIEMTARWFGAPLVIVYQNETPGLLSSEAERLGKITLGAELGWGSAIQAEGVRYGRQGVLAAAINTQQLAGEISPIDHHRNATQVKAAMVDRACFTVAPISGHYEQLVACGEKVSKGTIIGLIHDFERIDAEPWPARAGVDGIVVGQAWGARVRQGQHVVITGEILPWLE